MDPRVAKLRAKLDAPLPRPRRARQRQREGQGNGERRGLRQDGGTAQRIAAAADRRMADWWWPLSERAFSQQVWAPEKSP